MAIQKTILLISALAMTSFLASCCCNDDQCASAVVEKKSCNDRFANHPFLNPSLYISWSQLTPDKIIPDVTIALERANANIDKIAALPTDVPGALTYENTIGALWDNSVEFGLVWEKVSHMENVLMSDEFRKAYMEVLPKVAEYITKSGLNEDLWKVIKAYSETEEAKNLPPNRARHLNEVVNSFRDGGADLPEDKKRELAEISTELTKITQEFSQNVLDATNAYRKVVKDEALLAGIPESDKKAALYAAKKAGLATDEEPAWLFTLQNTSYLPVLKYAENEALRKEIWEATNTICIGGKYDNSEKMLKILELRQREAEILGEKNFSDLVLKRRMAKNGETAMAFVQKLYSQTKKAFDREYEELKAFRKANDPAYAGEDFQPWDLSYWTEKMRAANYSFDSSAVKPYFPMDEVMQGLFDLTEKLFNVKVVEEKSVYIEPGSGKKAPDGTYEVWHKDVKFYSFYDKVTNKKIGIFYTDWYPRESKRAGAWMNPCFSGDISKGEINYALICGNMTAPIGNDPALLTHYDVTTIYHEYGHLLHHLLGNSDVPALNGTAVAWDFVEVPSQLMENWVWEPEVLKAFAKHYKSGETIPADLVQKMTRARNFHSAYQQMRQLSMAYMDLFLHMNAKEILKTGKKLNDIGIEVTKDYTWPQASRVNTNLNRFTHLFRGPVGYASGYYSYKWAEALEADAYFSIFRNTDGSLNYDKGMNFRKKILEKGNTQDADVLYRDFVGRDPDWNAINVLHGISDK